MCRSRFLASKFGPPLHFFGPVGGPAYRLISYKNVHVFIKFSLSKRDHYQACFEGFTGRFSGGPACP